MSDFDDLQHHSLRLQGLKFNALDGILRLGEAELETGSQWVADMLTRRRGYGRTGDGVFEFYLTPVGSEPPAPPHDPKEFKPALAMIVFSPQFGLAEMITNSTLLRQTISTLWEEYKSYREAADGLLPVIEFGEPREVEIGRNNKRIFWTPRISIIGWVSRDEIPPLRYRPPTVEPPIRRDAQLPYRALAQLPAPFSEEHQAEPKKPRRKAAATPVADIIEDELPF